MKQLIYAKYLLYETKVGNVIEVARPSEFQKVSRKERIPPRPTTDDAGTSASRTSRMSNKLPLGPKPVGQECRTAAENL
ncbi:hypothetical protein BDV11DRAFT_187770 [Aspergillus similis]